MESILIYGLINAVSLALITLGFSLSIGISGVANLAFGGFYVFGAYFAWLLLFYLGIPYPLAILLSVLVTGLMGALMYWLVLMRVRGLILSEVIATLATGIAILEFLRWKGLGLGYEFNLPYFVKGSITIGRVSLDYQRLAIIGVGLILLLLLWFLTHYTKVGLAFRGIAQDEQTALSMGIRSDWTAMLSVAFGSALAAVAAIIILPLSMINVNTGYDVLLIAMAVAVVGGLESFLGIIVASFILGYAQIITAHFFAPHWMMVMYLIAIMVILAIKPSGLFGKFKEIEERV